jgi:hypothetical protein
MKYLDMSGAKLALSSLCAKFASSMWAVRDMLRKSAPNHFLMCRRNSNAYTTNENKLLQATSAASSEKIQRLSEVRASTSTNDPKRRFRDSA